VINNSRPVLFFDSGIGGLTIFREARIIIPKRRFIYIVDDAAFPYGLWKGEALRQRLSDLFSRLLKKYNPLLCVIACNTASTLALDELRAAFPDYNFVGTVPAIKPAAERSRSGLVSVLATFGTIRRACTHSLIAAHAGRCLFSLVGSGKLSIVAEAYLRGEAVDSKIICAEILPCFIEQNGKYTDIIVLACTHYPFLITLFRKFAPWPVDWLEPSAAIAHRIHSLLPPCENDSGSDEDIAFFISGQIDCATRRLFHAFGLKCNSLPDFLDFARINT